MRPGRPKEFDEQEALERAMQLFWTRGYAGASLAELLSAMGISRQSLYDTFGNKRSLFRRSIERYRETQLRQALDLLSRDGSPLENVRGVVAFFESLAADERCRGCLVANALVEVGSQDAELGELLEDTLGLLQEGVREALERARERGELGADKSPTSLSRAITNAMIGLAVTGKLRRGKSTLQDIYQGTVAMLG